MSEDKLSAEETIVIESTNNTTKLKFVNFNGKVISLDGCSKLEFLVLPGELPTLTVTYVSKLQKRVV